MTVDFEDRRENAADGDELFRFACGVIQETLSVDGISLQVNVGLSLVDNEEIRRINEQFRDIDEATDVLSFPMLDYDLKSSGGAVSAGDIDPASNELVLGDIVVSVERVAEQAREYGHSFQREFGYMVTHGMLHLLGYDHIEEADTQVMRAMEEKVLGSFSLYRD